MGKINTIVKKKAGPAGRSDFLRRYSRLVRSISQKDTKVVVSLGSGGVRMFAHLSVIRFLEKLGAERHISEVWGSSGGSIVSLFFAMGLNSDAIMREADEFFKSHELKLVPSVFSVAKNILKEAVTKHNGGPHLKGFHNIHESLNALVSRTLETGKERYPWFCLAYNLEKNRTDVLTPSQIPEGLYPEFIYRTDPLDAIIASSSIPVVFSPKMIQDASGKRTYTDGGAGEEVPTVSIYRKWQQDREFGLEKRKRLLVIAVDLGTDLSAGSFFEQWLIRKIPALQYLRMTIHLTDLVRRARIADQKRLLMRDPDVELWEINLSLSQVSPLDVKGIPTVMELADKCVPIEFNRVNDNLLV